MEKILYSISQWPLLVKTTEEFAASDDVSFIKVTTYIYNTVPSEEVEVCSRNPVITDPTDPTYLNCVTGTIIKALKDCEAEGCSAAGWMCLNIETEKNAEESLVILGGNLVGITRPDCNDAGALKKFIAASYVSNNDCKFISENFVV